MTVVKISRIETETVESALASERRSMIGLGELERLERIRTELKGMSDAGLGAAVVESVLVTIGILRGFVGLDRGLDTPDHIRDGIDQMLERAGSGIEAALERAAEAVGARGLAAPMETLALDVFLDGIDRTCFIFDRDVLQAFRLDRVLSFGEISMKAWFPLYMTLSSGLVELARAMRSLDILKQSRLSGGLPQFEPEPVDATAAAKRAIDAVLKSKLPGSETRKVDLTYFPQEVWVLGRADRLEACLYELVSNALRFSPKGSEVRLLGIDRGWKYQIVVEDNGPGFGDMARERAFDPFARGAKAPGAIAYACRPGLGLYVAGLEAQSIGGSLGFDRPEFDRPVLSLRRPRLH